MEVSLNADISKTDFRSRDITKNNFNGIDISQGLDLEPPSLFPYFLLISLIIYIKNIYCIDKLMRNSWDQISNKLNPFRKKYNYLGLIKLLESPRFVHISIFCLGIILDTFNVLSCEFIPEISFNNLSIWPNMEWLHEFYVSIHVLQIIIIPALQI